MSEGNNNNHKNQQNSEQRQHSKNFHRRNNGHHHNNNRPKENKPGEKINTDSEEIIEKNIEGLIKEVADKVVDSPQNAENEELDNEVASLEDIAKVAAESRAHRANRIREENQKIEKFSDKDHSQVENWEQYLEMNIQTGSNQEAEAIAANIFLSRGMHERPDIETPRCSEYRYNCCKLASYDWIEQMNISLDYLEFPIAEVRFKNSHKDFFILPGEGVFHVGDIVAVEANPGHDIGIISMLGLQVKKQLEHKRIKAEDVSKKLYRLARVSDIDKWVSTIDLEHATMLSSRYIAWDLNLKMKVNDVEYQGDGTKAIFYYSAEERVDFRELIKILAEQFRIRIEMRQIGVRQEAARLGGIGTCGRELCCSSWLTNFQSVSTSTARTQQLSLNPQKLAGMCGKLKCCLNFEQSTYIEESKGFPAPNVHLKTKKGKGFYNKIDIFKKIVWYSYADDNTKIFAIPLDKVNEIIAMNNEGKYPDTLEEFAVVNQAKVEEGVSYSMDELKRIEDK